MVDESGGRLRSMERESAEQIFAQVVRPLRDLDMREALLQGCTESERQVFEEYFNRIDDRDLEMDAAGTLLANVDPRTRELWRKHLDRIKSQRAKQHPPISS